MAIYVNQLILTVCILKIKVDVVDVEMGSLLTVKVNARQILPTVIKLTSLQVFVYNAILDLYSKTVDAIVNTSIA